MNLIHPLQEVIESNRTQRESASLLGVSPQYLSDMINQRRSVGARVAIRMEQAFGVAAMTILIRQAAHDLHRELQKGKVSKKKEGGAKRKAVADRVKVCRLPNGERTDGGSYWAKVDGENIGVNGRTHWETEAAARLAAETYRP